MSVVYKKFLPPIMRNTRWGDLITVFQDIVNDLKDQCVNVIKTKHITSLMTNAEMLEEAKKLGYNLLSLDGYTSSDEYLEKELLTIVPRISWKNTRTGYKYLYYIYNLVGDTFPIELNLENILEVVDDYWTTVHLRELTSYYLDTGGYLDSPSTWITTLDQNTTVTSTPTRNLVLSFSPRYIETASEFISVNTLKCFLNDVLQMKRATEIPYFEHRLLIPGYTDRTSYTKDYTSYDSTVSGSMESILIQGSLLDLSKIQIGTGAHTTLNTSITGVQSPVACGGDITNANNAISGGNYAGSSSAYAFNKQASYESNEITQGYQSWGFTTAKTNISTSGLSNNTTIYSGIIFIDGAANVINVTGRNAQTLQSVIQEINADLTGAYATFDTTGNGYIKITSRSVGKNSTVSIFNQSLFSSLTNRNVAAESAVNGVDTAESWKSAQTGSGTLWQAYIGQNNFSIAYKISKIKYKNSPNAKDNVSSVKVQWKYPTDALWNDIQTSAVVTDPSYWNTITVSDFTLSGVIKTTVNKNVIVGSSGEIQTSSDSITWAHQTPANGFNGTFNDITNSPTTYFAVGTSGEIQTSINSISWTHRTPASSYKGNFNGVIYGSGLVVAVGSSGVVQYSTNGTSWNQVILANEANNILNKVQYGNNRYLLAGNNGKIYSSPSGNVWTNHPLTGMFDGDYNGASYTYDGLSFVLGDKGILEKSYSGYYWQQASGIIQSGIEKSLYDIASNSSGTLYAAVGFNDTTNQTLITTSPNLSTWTNRTPASTTSHLKEITRGNDKFVAVGTGGEIEYSLNGDTWSQGGMVESYSYDFKDLAISSSGIIGVGNNANVFLIPSGTITGSTTPVKKYTTTDETIFNSVVKGNSNYVVVGEINSVPSILSSTDLATWTSQIPAQTVDGLNSIAYGSGTLVTVGNNGHIEKKNIYSGTITIGNNTGNTYSGTLANQIVSSEANDNCGGLTYFSTVQTLDGIQSSSLLKFSGLENIDSNLIIKSAKLYLYSIFNSGNSGIINIYRLLKNWGEGNNSSTPADLNESSWNHNLYPTTWDIPGAKGENLDRYISPSFSSLIEDTVGYIEFESEQLKENIQNIINQTNYNYGWLLEEATISETNAFAFGSKNYTDNKRPYLKLELEYNWQQQSPANSYTGDFNKVIYNSHDNQFAAVGTNGEIELSYDGETWDKQTISGSLYNGTLHSIACDNSGNYVAVGEGSGIISLTQINSGIIWQQLYPQNYTGDFYDVAYGNNKFMVVGSNREIQLSNSSGTVWSHVSTPAPFDTNNPDTLALTSYNNQFVLAGQDGNLWYTGDDGTSWGQLSLTYPVSYTSNLNSVIYTGEISSGLISLNQFVTVGSLDNSTNYAGLLTSTSGTIWNKQLSIPNDNLHKIIHDGTQYVTLGDQSTYTSISGTIWTQQGAIGASAGALNCIAYSPVAETYVTVGNSGLIYNSSDLTTWTRRTQANGYTGNFTKIINNNSTFIATGQYGEIQTSYDGVDWTRRNSSNGATANLKNIAYGNGVYITISDEDSKIYYSSDLINWHKNNGSERGNSYYGIVYGRGIFVIVGSNGDIETTTDGSVFTKRITDNSYTGTFYGVNYKNDLFVATGTNGEIQVSSDGINWIHRDNATGFNGTFHGNAYVGTNITTSNSTYMMRLLANSALNTNYYWELFNLQMMTDNLTLLELQHLEPLTATQLYARRIITEKNTFPNFTEMAIKDIYDNCVFYAKFPLVQWSDKMYSNPLFRVQLS